MIERGQLHRGDSLNNIKKGSQTIERYEPQTEITQKNTLNVEFSSARSRLRNKNPQLGDFCFSMLELYL